MSAISDIITKRRSCRNYASRTVRRKDIESILEAGFWAPSARDTQLWHFTVILNTEKLLPMNEIIKLKLEKEPDYCFFYNAPSLVIVSHPKDPRLAPLNCACALQNMLLTAESLGIASCWINQIAQTCNEPEIRTMLTAFGIPEDHEVYGCVSLGYATQAAKAPIRKKTSIHWIE